MIASMSRCTKRDGARRQCSREAPEGYKQCDKCRASTRKAAAKWRAANPERKRRSSREYARRKLGWYDDDPGLMEFVKEVVNS